MASLSLLILLVFHANIIFGLDKITVNPAVKLNYIFNKEPPVNTFEWKKWGGHHGLSEPNTIQSQTLLDLGAFANRWLKPDANYFTYIPPIKGTNLPDLSWFNNKNNQAKVISSFPTYLSQYGENEPLDMIYCIEGCTWPYYMINSSINATCSDSVSRNIPYNYSAAVSIITKSLEIIYQNTSKYPRYFEPQNEPYTQKFGKDVTVSERMNFQNYINYAIYKTFNGKIIIGGPAMDGIAWLKSLGNTTLFSQYFEYMINNAKNSKQNAYPLQFISWHFFSSFAIVSGTNYSNFYASGAVAGTMDLIESYTNSVNDYNGATKILISEHGYADEKDTGFNVTYKQWIAVTQYLTDTMLFLDRPESQWKIDGFYVNGKYAMNNDLPLVLVNDTNNKLTLTGQMYFVNKLLKDNGGNIVESVVDTGVDTVKVQSFYNNKTGKLVVAIKEMAWKATTVNVSISGLKNGGKVNGLRIYWDLNDGKFIYKNVTLDLSKNVYLSEGSALILYDIVYESDSNYKETMLCRRRYYSNDFSVKLMDKSISDTIGIDASELNGFYRGVLRVSLSWNIKDSGNVINYDELTPKSVSIDGKVLEISLKRIDNLVQNPNGMAWIAFEYDIFSNVLELKNSHPVEILFADIVKEAFVSSVVVEIYTNC